MKRLWNYVSFLAVVNLLALAMFVGWLWHSGRLSRDRVRQARDLFAPTLAEVQAQADERAATEGSEQAEAAIRARQADPPMPSGATVALTSLAGAQTDHALRRLQDQTDQHLAELAFRAQQLDRREAELHSQRKEWEASIAGEADRRRDEQFAKTVRLYESLAGKQAKQMLLELVKSGEIERAVTYLDAMQSRAATKTLRELKSDAENKLATELLERLRVLGIEPAPPETASDDRTSQPAPGSAAAADPGPP